MTSYDEHFQRHIDQIKSEGRYREFIDLARHAGDFPNATYVPNNEKIVVWCINDYLGMAQHPAVKQAVNEAVELMGAGSGGTRNIGGNNHYVVELEKEIADLHQKEQALVMTSGFVANEASLTSLAKIFPDIVFFSDADNHASIIKGICNSRAEKCIFRHNDMAHLRKLISSYPKDRPKIIVFESIYSMDGEHSPMAEICEIAQEFNAMTYLDEVHTVGLYGNRGAGIAESLGLHNQITIIQGTLGKAYGTMGGYIAASHQIIEAIRLTAPGFIFTTSLPPIVAAAALSSMRHLKNSDAERQMHQDRVRTLKQKLTERNINFLHNNSHIIPIIIGDPVLTKQASRLLLNKYKIFVQDINFPTVAKGTERLRITPTPCHNDEMIEEVVNALDEVLINIGIKKIPA